MKIVPNITFTAKDIREQLAQASADLPTVVHLANGVDIKVLKEGSTSYLYLYDSNDNKFVGVASVEKDKLLPLRVPGVAIKTVGLLKEYRGLGFIYRVLDKVAQTQRVIAGASMTKSGAKMWVDRIKLDRKHAYLIYRPQGFELDGGTVYFLPIGHHNVAHRARLAWDGSLKTRLIMLNLKDPLLRKFNVDLKNS